jgi:hypothetical protein
VGLGDGCSSAVGVGRAARVGRGPSGPAPWSEPATASPTAVEAGRNLIGQAAG